MNRGKYLSELAFEVLVRSQCDKPIYLPSSGRIEESSDADLTYAMYDLVKCGVLKMDAKGKGMDIVPQMAEFVLAVRDAKRVLKILGCDGEYPVYCYLTKKNIAIIELSQQREKAYRVGTIPSAELEDYLIRNLELPESTPETVLEDMEWDEEPSEVEKMLSVDDLQSEPEDVYALEDTESVMDVVSPVDGSVLERWVVYQSAFKCKLARQFRSGKKEYDPFSMELFHNQIQFLQEAIEC